MKYSLDYIWECIESQKIFASEREREIVAKLAVVEKELLNSFDSRQRASFSKFTDILSELNYTEREEAFVCGVKFATRLFLEATNG